MNPPRMISSGYFDRAVRDPQEMVEQAARTLEHENVEFDLIVCQGVSGLVFAPVLAFVMGKRLAVVRKSLSGSHASSMVEGYVARGDRCLMVDDFTSSFNTYIRCADGIKDLHMGVVPVGTYMYLYDRYDPAEVVQAKVKVWQDRDV